MKECNTEIRKVYVGFDISDENIEIFAVCGQETSKQTQKIANDSKAIEQFLKMFSDKNRVCVVMETGTHSLWISRLVKKLGFEVLVAHARDLKLIYASDKKNDSLDAERLARLAQADRKLLHPVEQMSEERQRDLLVLKARALLVKQQTQTVNTIRGFLKSNGVKDDELTVDNMRKKGYGKLPDEMKEAVGTLLEHLNYLALMIKNYDRQISKLCKKYKVTAALRRIKGVGPAISLAFVLLVGDPRRFPDAARLCAYFGLVPRQDQSGNTDKQLSITKKGNRLMRTLLVQGAQYIMGSRGEECDLREYGKRIEARGGQIAKKKARIAVARKLVALMLTLWRNQEIPYDPHFKQKRKTHRKATLRIDSSLLSADESNPTRRIPAFSCA